MSIAAGTNIVSKARKSSWAPPASAACACSGVTAKLESRNPLSAIFYHAWARASWTSGRPGPSESPMLTARSSGAAIAPPRPCAGVERQLDQRGVIVSNPDPHGSRGAAGDGGHHPVGRLDRDRPVFHVDQDDVEARMGTDLGQLRRRAGRPDAQLHTVGLAGARRAGPAGPRLKWTWRGYLR